MAGADAAVLVTEWSAIVGLDWAAAAADHALARPHRRPQRARPGGDDAARVHVRGHRAHPGARGRQPSGQLMQAVVLVGGEGRRLRPLTDTRPEADDAARGPALRRAPDRPAAPPRRSTTSCFSCGYRPDALEAHFGDGSAVGMRVRYVVDPEPLGTAGAIKNAEALLDGDALPRAERRHPHRPRPRRARGARHREPRRRGIVALTPVDDPSAFGLVRLHDDGLRRGLRREAAARRAAPRRALPHQRRHLPARARRRSTASRPAAPARSSARSSRQLAAGGRLLRPPERRLLARHRHARPRTWRPTTTCSRGALRHRVAQRRAPTSAPGARVDSAAPSVDALSSLGAGAVVAPGGDRAGQRGRRADAASARAPR